jgi:hypothetical protein
MNAGHASAGSRWTLILHQVLNGSSRRNHCAAGARPRHWPAALLNQLRWPGGSFHKPDAKLVCNWTTWWGLVTGTINGESGNPVGSVAILEMVQRETFEPLAQRIIPIIEISRLA